MTWQPTFSGSSKPPVVAQPRDVDVVAATAAGPIPHDGAARPFVVAMPARNRFVPGGMGIAPLVN
ncbi:MAG: hypothetical protein M3373_09430 [Gemmatimonadota bacterium]|nr:hypothetical protein [Gemmatimonadota bacterium]